MIPRQDIRKACGEMIIVGIPAAELTSETKALLKALQPLGVILFRHNLIDLQQTSELTHELKAWWGRPLLCSIDQEGGRVQRLPAPANQWPTMRQAASLSDSQFTEMARHLGKLLRLLNFDINFAPVLDVDTNPQNPIIGDRSFSSDPSMVAKRAAQFITEHQQQQVACCGKHFPGHGDTDTDSHLQLPILHHRLERLRQIEWPPFVAATQAQIACMMTAHVLLPELCPQPATLSPMVLQTLRSELGFQGVLIGDDLDMRALQDHYSIEEIALLGTAAGLDVFLACHHQGNMEALYRALVVGVETQKITIERLLVSQRRIHHLLQQFYLPPQSYKQVAQALPNLIHRGLGV